MMKKQFSFLITSVESRALMVETSLGSCEVESVTKTPCRALIPLLAEMEENNNNNNNNVCFRLVFVKIK